MWYKEWLLARVKFLLMAIVMIAIAGLFTSLSFSTLLTTSYQNRDSSLFNLWINLGIALIALGAIMGGVDTISNEVDNNTLSFLLSRPLTRSRVYLTKLGINALWISVLFTVSCLYFLAIDQIPRQVGVYEPVTESNSCGYAIYTGTKLVGFKLADSTPLVTGLFQTAAIVLIGCGLLCLNTLISLFTRNVTQSLTFGLAGTIMVYFASQIIGAFLGLNNYNYLQADKLPLTFTVVLFLTLIVFSIGLVAFKRKEI